ncbi:MAG: peptidylprolyl isomerase [Rubricoccaceae bacterium]|nr:peptidylprolyl isomerase [Rubricoccaceae bacterium]
MRYHFILLVCFAVLFGCGDDASVGGDYAARVDDQILTEEEIQEAMAVLPVMLDSVTARQQFIEQWVKNRLLAEEARRQGIAEREDVQRQLAESERSVLVASLIDYFFEANAAELEEGELQAYFDANRDQLTLLEPYLRIRLLSTTDPEDAEAARRSLERLQNSPFADSLWSLTAQEYSSDPQGAVALSSSFLPESRLFGLDSQVAQYVRLLTPGATSEVFESSGHYHVVQLVERIAAGTRPELDWIRNELTQRLAIEKRNSLLIRQIEELKNEAEAQGRLEIR